MLIEKLRNRIVGYVDSYRDTRYLTSHNLLPANSIFTHLTTKEKIELHKTVSSFKRNITAVEIGSYLGASACFISNAMPEGSKLFCIDTWGNDAMQYDESDIDGSKRDTYSEFKENTKSYSQKIVELRGWSFDVIHDFKKHTDKIDFLFIDGDHNYEGVKRDWDLYGELLRKNSIVVFHDTGWADGVIKVINENASLISTKIFDLPNMQGFRIN